MGSQLLDIASKSHWLGRWIARREIRAAVRREIHDSCISLNFALLRSLQDNLDEHHARTYFAQPRGLRAVEDAIARRGDVLQTMPESERLQNWNGLLKQLTIGSAHPMAFRMIEMLSALLMPPLTNCVSRETRKFVERILDRPEVSAFRTAYYAKWARRIS